MSHDKSRLVESVGVAGSGSMLIHGDCLASCGFLKERIDAGQMRPVDLVYIDPPFASGFSYGTRVRSVRGDEAMMCADSAD